MNSPRTKIKASTLVSGDYYLQRAGTFVRRIEGFDGDNVYWSDRIGEGRCTKQSFVNRCPHQATSEEVEALYKAPLEL